MQEDFAQKPVVQQGPIQPSGYSTQVKSKDNGSKWIVVFILLLILGGGGIFFFTSTANKPIAIPTPTYGVVPIETIPTSTPLPTKTPEPVVKSSITIEIQNGTGITGEAKLLQDKLKQLGYSEITVGNADTTDNTETTVTFKKTLSPTAQDTLKSELEDFYKTVNTKTSTTQKVDVLIITGLRGTQTSKPATTGTPKATSSATLKPSASPSPSGN